MKIAFQAILHNLFVIGHHYHRIVPEISHRTVESDLGPLEKAVRRLRSTELATTVARLRTSTRSASWRACRG